MAGFGIPPPVVFLKSVFAVYDKDCTESFNSAELKSLCYDLGYYLTDDEAQLALDILDQGIHPSLVETLN